MQLIIYVIGKMKNNPFSFMVDDYLNRLKNSAKNIGISSVILYEASQSRENKSDLRKKEEAQKLLDFIKPGAKLILCDEDGQNLTSRDLSNKFDKLIQSGAGQICFAIGGADGFDDNLKQQAELLLSFGKLTWPHQLARVMLVEQLYRVVTILLNHPYHRD